MDQRGLPLTKLAGGMPMALTCGHRARKQFSPCPALLPLSQPSSVTPCLKVFLNYFQLTVLVMVYPVPLFPAE